VLFAGLKDRTKRRIRVRQGSECVPLAPGTPTLSSAHSPWEGTLLERHRHGPYRADDHEHPTYFLCLHLSEPAPLLWRTNGTSGSKVVGPGSLVLLSRGTHDSVSFPKPVERILFTLEPRVFQHALQEHHTGRDVELVDQWGVQDRQIEYILRALEADLDAGSPAGKLFGQSLTNALAVHLQRRYSVTPPKTMNLRGGLPSARLKRVQEYIEANLDQEVALSQLAATAGMSSHYFAELFKQSVGLSPHQYVLRRRIQRARKLLHDSNMRILEAGVRSGFSDQSHFTKIFRRMVGVTPTEYRSML
jgi:AraC family transcriptional regulator